MHPNPVQSDAHSRAVSAPGCGCPSESMSFGEKRRPFPPSQAHHPQNTPSKKQKLLHILAGIVLTAMNFNRGTTTFPAAVSGENTCPGVPLVRGIPPELPLLNFLCDRREGSTSPSSDKPHCCQCDNQNHRQHDRIFRDILASFSLPQPFPKSHRIGLRHRIQTREGCRFFPCSQTSIF